MSHLETRRNWTEAASHWARHADRIARMTRPATAALLDALALVPGLEVLDVASGVGDPALAIAERVGPAGSVIATDEVPAMLATLAARARTLGLSGVVTRHVPAEDLDLEACVDRVSCRFGAMFFAQPERALAAMRRAARPRARLALVVWGRRERNPYFTEAPAVLDALGVPPDAAPPERTVFEWSEPGALAARVRAAGWGSVRESVHPFTLALPDVGAADLFDFLCDMSRTVRTRVERLDEPWRARLAGAVAQRMAAFEVESGLAFPAEFTLVVAVA